MPIVRISRGIGLALVVAWAATPAFAQRTKDVRAEAFQLYQAGRYREALPLFDAVLAKWTRDTDAHVRRGGIYLRLNEPEHAIADFDAALRVNPLHGSALLDRGIGRVMLGLHEAALQDFVRSFQLFSLPLNRVPTGQCDALCGIAQVYHRIGRNAEAVQDYTRAIGYNPNDPNPYVGRGDALVALEQTERALPDYDQAIRLQPNHSRAYASRGEALIRLGKSDRALTDLDRAIQLDPGYAYARRLRGGLLSGQGQHEKALADLDAVIQNDPKDAGARKDRGGILVRLGRYDRAIEDLNVAIRLDPRKSSAYQNRGAAYNALGQYERAIRDFEEAIHFDPKNAGAHTNIGLAQFALGHYEEAIALLSEAIRLDPNSAIAYCNRANAYAQLNLLDEAVRDYNAAIVIAPRFAAAFNGLGKALDALGQGSKAIEEYDMAVRLTPGDAALHARRGNARRSQGDWDGAIADYSRALEIDPRHAESYLARGWARLIADRDGAEADARAYLVLQRGDDPLVPYMAILGALAARRAGHEAEASAFLAEALANLSPTAWPAPVLRYLNHNGTDRTLFDAAGEDGLRQTEAHVFLGMDRLFAGDRTGAREHLRWVGLHGQDSAIALDLARETLRRLDATPPTALAP